MNSLVEAARQWKVAQSGLFEAINAFHDACTAFEAAADWSHKELGDCTSVEAIIREVAICLPDIKSYRQHLYSAELAVCRIFNNLTSLVPISKLPTEIFCRTLSLAVSSSPCLIDKPNVSEDDEKDGSLGILAVIQLVCSRWRHLVINTPSLWSHVDILGNHPSTGDNDLFSKFTRIRLRRAAGIPICLHFHQTVREYPDFRVALFLQPYLHKAYSVIFSKCPVLLVRTIIETCSSHTVPDLNISSHIPRDLETNLLQTMQLGWPRRTLSRIVDLQIKSSDFRLGSYRPDPLLVMLSSNPLIRTLRLDFMPRHSSREPQSFPRVSLPHLELLEVWGINSYSFLSELTPGTADLDLRLSAPWDEEDFVVELRSFSERSRIKLLTLNTIGDTSLEYLRPCISSMPHLYGLFLDDGFYPYSTKHMISNTLLAGDVPKLDRLPTPGHIWTCSALFPNIKVFGLVSFRSQTGR
ncbi:hypothetical protein FRC08_015365, partial [Ceratobasidium sp. 394]